MNIVIGKKTFGRHPRFNLGLIIAGVSAAAVLTSVAVWQATESGSSRTIAEPSAPVALPVEQTNRTATPATNYYLVDSQAQAETILQAEFEAQMSYAGLGTEWDRTTEVINVSTPEGQAALQALQAGNTEDQLNGGAGVNILDLTAGPSPASASNAEARSFVPGPAATTIYIVGSEAQKLALEQEVSWATAVEGGDNVSLTIMVVETPEQERLYALMLLEQTSILDPGVNVVDLR